MAKLSYIYRHKRRTVLGLSVIILLMIYFFKDASFSLRAISTIAFITFFYFVDRFFDIKFKAMHYIFIVLISVFSFLFSPFYFIYPQYDKIQHFIQPILVSSIIFYMVNKLNLKMKWKLTFTLFIALGILGLFEIGEYVLDRLFDLKLQGVYLRDIKGIEKFNLVVDRIDDTMIDLVFGALGSIAYTISTGTLNRKELLKR